MSAFSISAKAITIDVRYDDYDWEDDDYRRELDATDYAAFKNDKEFIINNTTKQNFKVYDHSYPFEITSGERVNLNYGKLMANSGLLITGGVVNAIGVSNNWESEAGINAERIDIWGGEITLKNADLNNDSNEGFYMTGGTINMETTANGICLSQLGSEGEYVYRDTPREAIIGGKVEISGGIINVKGGSKTDLESIPGSNYLSGKDITISGGKLNILKDASLKAMNNIRDNPKNPNRGIFDKSTIKLQEEGEINLSGMLQANIDIGEGATAGTLNINDSAAKIIGDVSGINLVFNSDYGLTKDNLNISDLNSMTVKENHAVSMRGNWNGYSGKDLVPEPDADVGFLLVKDGATLELNKTNLVATEGIDILGTVKLKDSVLEAGLDNDSTPEEADMNINGGRIEATNSDLEATKDINITNGSEVKLLKGGKEGNGIYAEGNVSIDNSTVDLAANTYIVAENEINITNGSDVIIGKNASLMLDTTVNLTDSSIGLSGEIDANLSGNGTLNINDTAAKVVGDISGLNLAINSKFNIDNIEGNIEQLENLDINKGGLTASTGGKVFVNNLTISGGETYLKGDGFSDSRSSDYVETSKIRTSGETNITGGTIKIDSLRGLIAEGNNDINISGGKIIGENSWNTKAEIKENDTYMGNNLSHYGTGDINITGGEINFKDHASITATTGDINISGGKVILSKDAEIWSKNSDAKTVISGNADISITSGACIAPEGTLEIQGGTINATEAEIAGIKAFNMTAGKLNLNNGMFGAEGPKVYAGDDSYHRDGTVVISGGEINVAGRPSIKRIGIITEDDKANILSGGDITMNGGIMNIQKDAFLSVRNGYNKDGTYGELSTIDFTDGIINLKGTLEGNLLGSTSLGYGLLNINDSAAKVIGNITDIDMAINTNFDFNNFSGVVNDLNNLTISAGKKLTLNLNADLTDDENLHAQNFSMNKGSTLNINGADDNDRDLKAWNSVYATGTINLNYGGLKLGENTPEPNAEDIDGTFTIENATVTAKNADIISRTTGRDMDIINTKMSLDYSALEKSYAGDLNIMGSNITLSRKGGFGAFISKVDWDDDYEYATYMTGDINIQNSTITMNDNSYIYRGNWEYDDDTEQFEVVEATGSGSINIKDSTITMNNQSNIVVNNYQKESWYADLKADNSQITMNNGSHIVVNNDGDVNFIDLYNGSTLNINGKADISLLGENAGGIRFGSRFDERNTNGKNTVLNLNKGSTLSVITDGTQSWVTLYAEKNSVLNIAGTLKGVNEIHVNSGAILNTTTNDTGINHIFTKNGQWKADNTWINSSLTTLNNSILNLTNSKVICLDDAPEISLGNGTQANLSKNTMLGGNYFSATESTITAKDNTVLGALTRVKVQYQPDTSPYDGYTSEMFQILTPSMTITDTDINLNGNSSLVLSPLMDIEDEKHNWSYNIFTPSYYYAYPSIIKDGLNRTTAATDYESVNSYAGDINVSGGSIILNNNASIANNSLTKETSEGNINFENTIINVNGKNTITATGDITLNDDSELHINKGGTLTVNSNFDSDAKKYLKKEIQVASSTVKLAGTLNGTINFTDNYSTLILGDGYKLAEDGLKGDHLSGIGVSGVTSAKSLATLSSDLGGFTFNEFTITDKSNLSATALWSILENADTLKVKNNSTLTIDRNLELSNLEIDGSTLNVKDTLLNVNGISLKNSNLTVDGKKDFTAIYTSGRSLTIENDPNTKANITLTNADIDLLGIGDMTVTNSSLKIAGDAKKIDTFGENYLRLGELNVTNTGNAKASVNLSNIYVEGKSHSLSTMTFTDTSSIVLNNVAADNLNVQNAKTLSITNRGFADLALNNVDTITIKGADLDNLQVDTSQKLTLSNLLMGNATTTSLTDVQKFELNNVMSRDGNIGTAGDLTIGVSENNATEILNPDTPREKIVYHSTGTLTNTKLSNLMVDNAYLTLNKGNKIDGTLTIKDSYHTDPYDLMYNNEYTYVLLKDNLEVDNVSIEAGVLEVAKGKTLTVKNGLTTVNQSGDIGGQLFLSGTLIGDITETAGSLIKIKDSAGKIIGDANLNTVLRFSNTKGKLSDYITGNLTMGGLQLEKNSDLTLDRSFDGGFSGSPQEYNMRSIQIEDSQLHLTNNDISAGYLFMDNSKLYLGTNKLTIDGESLIGAKSTIYVDVDKNGNYGQLDTDTLVLETNNANKVNNITLAVTLPRKRENGEDIAGKTYNFLTYNTLMNQDGGVVKDSLNVTVANNRYRFHEDTPGHFTVTENNNRGVIEKYSGISGLAGVKVNNLSMTLMTYEGSNEKSSATDNAIADNLHALSQQIGSEGLLVDALSALSPEDEGIIQNNEMSTVDTMMNTISSKMASGAPTMGLNAGDSIGNNGSMWVQGLYNHTKLGHHNGYAGFKGNSRGMAMGVDFNFTDSVKGGLAYHYTDSDIKSGNRKMDVDTHGVALYSEYKPNHWFVDGIAGFSFSDYDARAESVLGRTNSDFDVYTYSAQATTGYEFEFSDKVKMTPSVGLRYALIDQDDYTDSDGKQISSDKNSILTFRMGDKLAWEYVTDKGTRIAPEIYLGMSYDLHTDQSQSLVTLSNGSSYQVEGRNLKRFGVNGGIGTKITSDDWDFMLGADMDMRQDYRSYTGTFKAKYHF